MESELERKHLAEANRRIRDAIPRIRAQQRRARAATGDTAVLAISLLSTFYDCLALERAHWRLILRTLRDEADARRQQCL